MKKKDIEARLTAEEKELLAEDEFLTKQKAKYGRTTKQETEKNYGTNPLDI